MTILESVFILFTTKPSLTDADEVTNLSFVGLLKKAQVYASCLALLLAFMELWCEAASFRVDIEATFAYLPHP